MTVKRMDNVGIVVEDIDAAIEFFTELGLELEGRAPVEGVWADGVTGLRDMRVETLHDEAMALSMEIGADSVAHMRRALTEVTFTLAGRCCSRAARATSAATSR